MSDYNLFKARGGGSLRRRRRGRHSLIFNSVSWTNVEYRRGELCY